MVNLFIANLDWEITSEDLLATFSSFGPVSYAHVVFDNKTKKSKGFGYIEMEETDHAINAINALNGMEINGRKLDVKIASPKTNRPLKEKKSPLKPIEFKKKEFKKPGYQTKKENFNKPNPVKRDSDGRVIK
jgi:RNA recognition motif-containing protein